MTAADPATGPSADQKPAVNLPDEALAWLGLIRQCDQQIKEAEETKQVARRHIEQLLGAYEIGAVGGRPVVRWTYVHSDRFQQKKFAEQHPDLYEQFQAPQVTRRFSLVEDER